MATIVAITNVIVSITNLLTLLLILLGAIAPFLFFTPLLFLYLTLLNTYFLQSSYLKLLLTEYIVYYFHLS